MAHALVDCVLIFGCESEGVADLATLKVGTPPAHEHWYACHYNFSVCAELMVFYLFSHHR